MKLTLRIVALLGLLTIITNSNGGSFVNTASRTTGNVIRQGQVIAETYGPQARAYYQKRAANTALTTVRTPSSQPQLTWGQKVKQGLTTLKTKSQALSESAQQQTKNFYQQNVKPVWESGKQKFDQGLTRLGTKNAGLLTLGAAGVGTAVYGPSKNFKDEVNAARSEMTDAAMAQAIATGNEPNKLSDEVGMPITDPAEVANTLMNTSVADSTTPAEASRFAYYSKWVKDHTKDFANYISKNYTWMVNKGKDAGIKFKQMMTKLFQSNPELAAEFNKDSKGRRLLNYLQQQGANTATTIKGGWLRFKNTFAPKDEGLIRTQMQELRRKEELNQSYPSPQIEGLLSEQQKNYYNYPYEK